MFWSICATKGGVGTSVIAAALALESRNRGSVLVVDLGGDLPDLLGVEPATPGLRDWLVADESVEATALLELTHPVSEGLELLPAGDIHAVGEVAANRVVDVVATTTARFDTVVADLGVVTGGAFGPAAVLAAAGDRSCLVVRACYLTLQRARRVQVDVDDVIEVVEPGRALRTIDIEAVIGRPVTSRVPVDPAIARSADAGLLTARLPRRLRRGVRRLLDSAPV